MKKILSLILFFLFVLTIFAEVNVKFDKKTYNLGRIKEEEGPHKYRFKFYNNGETSVKVLKVTPD